MGNGKWRMQHGRTGGRQVRIHGMRVRVRVPVPINAMTDRYIPETGNAGNAGKAVKAVAVAVAIARSCPI